MPLACCGPGCLGAAPEHSQATGHSLVSSKLNGTCALQKYASSPTSGLCSLNALHVGVPWCSQPFMHHALVPIKAASCFLLAPVARAGPPCSWHPRSQPAPAHCSPLRVRRAPGSTRHIRVTGPHSVAPGPLDPPLAAAAPLRAGSSGLLHAAATLPHLRLSPEPAIPATCSAAARHVARCVAGAWRLHLLGWSLAAQQQQQLMVVVEQAGQMAATGRATDGTA